MSSTLLIGERAIQFPGEGLRYSGDLAYYSGGNCDASVRAAGRLYPLWKQTLNDYNGNAVCHGDPTGDECGNRRFGSHHPGIVHFSFADGHVQQLSMWIEPYTLELLSMRNDGEVIPNW